MAKHATLTEKINALILEGQFGARVASIKTGHSEAKIKLWKKQQEQGTLSDSKSGRPRLSPPINSKRSLYDEDYLDYIDENEKDHVLEALHKVFLLKHAQK